MSGNRISLELPSVIREKLNENAQLNSIVEGAISSFVPWLDARNMPFFPEFTDHGPAHIASVINTVASLISDEAAKHFTPMDACLLVLSSLLHDAAMHLSRDGFLALIGRKDPTPIVDGLSDRPWWILWQDFYAEARRWDDRKLNDVFGDVATPHVPGAGAALLDYIQQPESLPNTEDWSTQYHKFIGEFLRRHHARLAHEIALAGVPGPDASSLLTLGVCDKEIADLAGLVARSHNLPIRDTFGYLERRYASRVEYRGAHCVFLMVLLRVADYLELQSTRAPHQLLSVRRLRSPVSVGEWRAHAAVRDIRHDDHDPEAIFVDAFPDDVKTYFKLKSLLEGLQLEMDISWAVLGEVYGNQIRRGLNQLGLTLRRVKSNLDDTDKFASAVGYVPIRAAFDADPSLLKLLIVPLYGNRPEVGIRELVQNAVDAVQEHREVLKQQRQGATSSIPLAGLDASDPTGDVTVQFSKNPPPIAVDVISVKSWLMVRDKGIGMTASTVRDYFLRAGASYRKSAAWRKQFLDDQGNSKVVRSGRFGIGILAAFLLGRRMIVATRHANEKVGLIFTATIEDDVVELRHNSDLSVGTTVWVELDDNASEYLSSKRNVGWDWYCLTDPIVKRERDNEVLKQHFCLPPLASKAIGPWRVFRHPKYSKVFWSYSNDAPELCCNGILVVKNRVARTFETALSSRTQIEVPRISVFDPNGHLPLNLQRTELLYDEFASDDHLFEDVLLDLLAYVLVHAPTHFVTDPMARSQYKTRVDYPGWSHSRYNILWCEASCWLATAKGAIYCHPWTVARAGIDRIFVGGFSPEYKLSALFPTTIESPHTAVAIVEDVLLGPTLHRAAMEGATLPGLEVDGIRIAITTEHVNSLLGSAGDPKAPGMRPRQYSKDWVVYEQGKPRAISQDVIDILKRPLTRGDHAAGRFMMEIFCKGKEDQALTSRLTELWNSLLGSTIIPYEKSLRERTFKKAFKKLSHYISLWNGALAR